MLDPISTPVLNDSDKYGAAAKYDFDNPQKWVTVESVPLLDEHEMTNEEGKPVAFVDRTILQEIAQNNNRRVRETGDPATLILGHTSEDPRAEEKPAKGFVVNYKVVPFKRDPKTGQMRYTIAGDYKFRPKNAHLIEEYPRRSVELWWNKKELDPIAMLGGTSPERDLSVVIRNARFNHVAIEPIDRISRASAIRGVESEETESIHFSIRAGKTIERYSIDHVLTRRRFAQNKVEKVMGEFKHGELHSGSKNGPKVTSRDQAIAIAMNEAGKSRKNSRGDAMAGEMREQIPSKYAMGADDNCDDDMKQYMAGDGTDDYDGGDEAVDPNDDTDSAENDPVLAKVFQSKQWKDLSSKIDMIAQALAPDTAGGDGMGGDALGGGTPNEMPPPGAGAMPGAAPPMGAGAPPPGPPSDGMDGYPPEEEMDERRMHGANPVQFNSTGLPGPMNTNIPTTGPKKKMMSRNGTAVDGSPARNGRQTSAGTTNDPILIRMSAIEKENKQLLLKLARSEVAADMRALKDEGILFGDTPEVQKVKEAEHIELLANLKMQGDEHYQCELENIRSCYARRKPNPAAPVYPGVARFARSQVGESESPEDFEPADPQEAANLADFQYVRKMSRADAVKEVMKLRRQS